jgi:hypothetical protein
LRLEPLEERNLLAQGLAVVPSPQIPAGLGAAAAISASDIWAVGGASGFPSMPIAEHFDGTSWSIVATPSGVSSLNGLTALSDGTVVAVGKGTNGSAVTLRN